MSSRRSRKRRQLDAHDLEPVVEVLAERARGDRLVQVAVGGRDQPDVDLDRLVRADPDDLAALQHAQQLDLGGQRHVADLVEEQRAAVGVLEPALAVAVGAGERPLDVAEELALQDVLAERGAVQGDERLVLAAGCCCGWPWRPAPCRCRSRR